MSNVSIRQQIYDKLAADSTLLSLLAKGASSIVNESEDVSTDPTPLITIHYSGPHPHQMIPELDCEVWEIKCFDRNEAYFNIERILERVRHVLHRAILDVNVDGTSSGLEIQYAWRIRSRYDPYFRQESQAVAFFVYTMHSS